MSKIPTYLIHGSLGSGKTTLLKHLLDCQEFKGSVVIENEYASYNLDQELIDGGGGEIKIYDVSGGCICCSSGQELLQALNEVINSSNVNALFIETTGVASSVQLIKQLMLSTEFDDNFILVRNVFVIDLLEDSFGNLKKNKFLDISMADLIVLNKSDLVDISKLEEYKGFFKITTDAKIVSTSYGKVDAASVYSKSKSRAVDVLAQNMDKLLYDLKDHSKETLYQVIYPKRKISKKNLLKELKTISDTKNVELKRVKGMFTDTSGKRTLVSATKSNVEFESLEGNREGDVLILIGKNITRANIESLIRKLC